MESAINISTFDLIIIIVYLLGIMTIGIWVGYRKKTSSEQFFLAGKSLRWPVIGAALFTANISTIHLVGLAADGYRIGIVVGNFEWMASITLILLGLVFAPFHFRSKISTLPEYLEKRYDSTSRMIISCSSAPSSPGRTCQTFCEPSASWSTGGVRRTCWWSAGRAGYSMRSWR